MCAAGATLPGCQSYEDCCAECTYVDPVRPECMKRYGNLCRAGSDRLADLEYDLQQPGGAGRVGVHPRRSFSDQRFLLRRRDDARNVPARLRGALRR